MKTLALPKIDEWPRECGERAWHLAWHWKKKGDMLHVVIYNKGTKNDKVEIGDEINKLLLQVKATNCLSAIFSLKLSLSQRTPSITAK